MQAARPYRIEATRRPRAGVLRPSCGPLAAVSPAGADADRPASPDASELRRLIGEFVLMKGAIAAVRGEIATSDAAAWDAPGMRRAAVELDAIVAETERATTTILDAVEEIEQAAQMLRATGHGAGRLDPVGTILDRVLMLYEACNFQDVTGQRIRKIVATLTFVEERLDAVIGPLDATHRDATDQAVRRPASPGAPQAGAVGHVSQIEVDRYFLSRDPPVSR